MWIRRDSAFSPLVTVDEFGEALRIIQSRCAHLTNEELLERLKHLLSRSRLRSHSFAAARAMPARRQRVNGSAIAKWLGLVWRETGAVRSARPSRRQAASAQKRPKWG
jgi:hypothetical protein